MTRPRVKGIAFGLLSVTLATLSGCIPTLSWRPIAFPSMTWKRNLAIPDRYPLGSVMREHFHTMQTNGEAGDFVLYHNDFVGDTPELTHDGRDKVMEIAARMRSAPFPVLVERSENNSNPQLDGDRRQMVALVLGDLGNPDADQRTFVSPAYGRGQTSMESQVDYMRYVFSRGGFGGANGGFNNGTNNSIGGFGGFGAAGGGFGR